MYIHAVLLPPDSCSCPSSCGCCSLLLAVLLPRSVVPIQARGKPYYTLERASRISRSISTSPSMFFRLCPSRVMICTQWARKGLTVHALHSQRKYKRVAMQTCWFCTRATLLRPSQSLQRHWKANEAACCNPRSSITTKAYSSLTPWPELPSGQNNYCTFSAAACFFACQPGHRREALASRT